MSQQKGVCMSSFKSGLSQLNEEVVAHNDFLLFPVVPHVLHVVVLFHDVQQLFHSKPSVSGDIEGERGENPTSKVLQYPSIINKQRSSEPTFSLAQG